VQIRLSAAAAALTTDKHDQLKTINRLMRCDKAQIEQIACFKTFSQKCQIFAINFRRKQHQRAICQNNQLDIVSNKKSAKTLHEITTVTDLNFNLVFNFNRRI